MSNSRCAFLTGTTRFAFLLGLVTTPLSCASARPDNHTIGSANQPDCYVPSDDIVSDCQYQTDVTDAFNSWIQSVPNGTDAQHKTIIRLPPNACYLTNGTIEFNQKQNIAIDGNGATIKATVAVGSGVGRSRLSFNLGGGFEVRDLTLEGTNHASDCAGVGCYVRNLEYDHGISVLGTDGVLIDNVRFNHAMGDALTVQPGGSWDGNGVGAVMSRNITVKNSKVDTASRHAFSCTDCQNFVVQDTSITNIGWWVVDVEPEATTWTGDVTLERNTFSKVHFGLLGSASGFSGQGRGPFIVRDNVQDPSDLPSTCEAPICIGGANGCGGSVDPLDVGTVTISNNRLIARGTGIEVSGSPHVDVMSNSIKVIPGGCDGNGYTIAGAKLKDVSSGRVVGNTFAGEPTVVESQNANNVTVCGNRTTATGTFSEPTICSVTPPLEIASDCSVDSTAAFNSWIGTLADGTPEAPTTISLAPNGCYLSNGTIAFTDRHNMAIQGNGATIKAVTDLQNGPRAQLEFVRGGGFTVDDITLQGTNFSTACWGTSCFDYSRQSDANLRTRGSDGLVVNNVHLKNAWGDGVEVDPGCRDANYCWALDGSGAVIAKNVTIKNSTVDTAAREAFFCTGCQNFVVQDNTITNIGNTTAAVQPQAATWPADITLERNTYSHVFYGLFSASGGEGPFVVRDNMESPTDLPGTCYPPINVDALSSNAQFTIANNTLFSRGTGITITGSHVANVDMTSNTITLIPGGCDGNGFTIAGTKLTNVLNGRVVGNTFAGEPAVLESQNTDVTNCGNRTSATGTFTEPSACP